MSSPLTDVGNMYATWTDPEGTVWQLTDISPDLGYFTTWGVGGWDARPFEFVTDPLPRGGDSVRFIRAHGARITWPLHIYADTHMDFVERYRALRKAFLMTASRGQPGVLRVSRPDGSAREIEAYYEDGWTGEPGQGRLSASPILTLFAPDGAWTDILQTEVVRSFDADVDFLDPFPSVSSSQVLGATTVTNGGDLEAWPEWTIHGPADAVTATNNTTGYEFELTYSILAGETITINTRELQVRGPAGQNLVSAISWPESYLWPLAPGDNDVEFTVGGSGAGTEISLLWHNRYEGA